jgi:hypothetical protein
LWPDFVRCLCVPRTGTEELGKSLSMASAPVFGQGAARAGRPPRWSWCSSGPLAARSPRPVLPSWTSVRTPQPGWSLSPEDRDQAGQSRASTPMTGDGSSWSTGGAQVTVPPVQHAVPGGPGVAEPGRPGTASTRCQRTSARGGRHSTDVSCRGQTSHSTRPGRGHARETRCRHQRRTRAMPGSRSCRNALMPNSARCPNAYSCVA